MWIGRLRRVPRHGGAVAMRYGHVRYYVMCDDCPKALGVVTLRWLWLARWWHRKRTGHRDIYGQHAGEHYGAGR